MSTTAKRNYTAATLAVGPGRVLRYCIFCGQELQDGQHWRKLQSPDGAYAGAAHDACLARHNGQGKTH